jgi:cell division protease FtsH
MAGRVAEEIIFGTEKVTSGASSDIKMATNMAQAMVTEWGLSEKLGPIFHGRTNEDIYASGGGGDKGRSEKTSEIIDDEVKRIIKEGYDFAKNILTTHLDQLHILAKALIERETMSGKEIKNLLSGRDIESEEENDFPFGKDQKILSKAAKKTEPKGRGTKTAAIKKIKESKPS